MIFQMFQIQTIKLRHSQHTLVFLYYLLLHLFLHVFFALVSSHVMRDVALSSLQRLHGRSVTNLFILALIELAVLIGYHHLMRVNLSPLTGYNLIEALVL